MEVLVVPVLALHLLCVNVGSAGPMVCMWLEWREGQGSRLAGRFGRRLAKASLASLLLGVVLGFLLGWLVWSDELQLGLARLGSRVTYALIEMPFSLVLMAGQLVWWNRASVSSRWQRGMRMFLLLLAGTNLLYHFPFFFVVLSDLAETSQAERAPMVSAEFRAAMVQGLVLARTVHFWLASFAVTGVFFVADRLLRPRQDSEEDTRQVTTWGSRIALVCTLLQVPIGMWLLFQLPRDVTQRLMGGDPLATFLLVAALLAVFWLIQQLFALATGGYDRKTCWQVVISMGVVVLLMVAASRHTRSGEAVGYRHEMYATTTR